MYDLLVFYLVSFRQCFDGSFENEALENKDWSTKHPKLENEAPKTQNEALKTRKQGTQNSKTKTPKTRNLCSRGGGGKRRGLGPRNDVLNCKIIFYTELKLKKILWHLYVTA